MSSLESLSERFSVISGKLVKAAGSIWAFVWASIGILIWFCTGPIFGFSDTWQLVANTATSFVTFLMVFIIQNSQNKDTRALHLKLDEVILSLKGARNEFMNIENLSDKDLHQLEIQLKQITQKHNHRSRRPRRRKNRVDTE